MQVGASPEDDVPRTHAGSLLRRHVREHLPVRNPQLRHTHPVVKVFISVGVSECADAPVGWCWSLAGPAVQLTTADRPYNIIKSMKIFGDTNQVPRNDWKI